MPSSVSSNGIVRQVKFSVVTTDATNTLRQWLSLPSAGSGASFNANMYAMQDNAQRYFGQTYVGSVARNSTGTGAGLTIAVGPSGYVDTATTPWSTVGAPAGWNASPVDLSASPTISLQVQGAAGQNITWVWVLNDVYLWGGATILLA